jgi:hypothetical protein
MSLYKQEFCRAVPRPWETLIPSLPWLPSVNPISVFGINHGEAARWRRLAFGRDAQSDFLPVSKDTYVIGENISLKRMRRVEY